MFRRTNFTGRWTSLGRLARWALALVVVVAPSGCVQRRLTIRTNPPGALVYIDKHEIGTTPVATDYVYYGTREIRMVKDGYETLTVKQFIRPPWYELFPIEFVSENLVPGEIRDERTFEFNLAPQVNVPTEQLLGRAENLRQGSHTEGYVPPPTVKQPGDIFTTPWMPGLKAPAPEPIIVQPLPAPTGSGS